MPCGGHFVSCKLPEDRWPSPRSPPRSLIEFSLRALAFRSSFEDADLRSREGRSPAEEAVLLRKLSEGTKGAPPSSGECPRRLSLHEERGGRSPLAFRIKREDLDFRRVSGDERVGRMPSEGAAGLAVACFSSPCSSFRDERGLPLACSSSSGAGGLIVACYYALIAAFFEKNIDFVSIKKVNTATERHCRGASSAETSPKGATMARRARRARPPPGTGPWPGVHRQGRRSPAAHGRGEDARRAGR